MWCSLAGWLDAGSGGGAVDRDGVSGCGTVSLASRTKAAAVDPSTEMAPVCVVQPRWRVGQRCWRLWILRQRRRQWVCRSHSGESDEGGCGGASVDTDGVGECSAVSLASRTKAVAVDALTETSSVGVVQSRWRRRRRCWCCELDKGVGGGGSRRQWVQCSLAGALVDTGGGESLDRVVVVSSGQVRRSRRLWLYRHGSVDRDEISGCGVVEPASLTKAAAVDPSAETASVGVVQSSLRV